MRNVAVQMYVSLDGVMAAPEKWTLPYWTDDHEKYAYERLLTADALRRALIRHCPRRDTAHATTWWPTLASYSVGARLVSRSSLASTWRA